MPKKIENNHTINGETIAELLSAMLDFVYHTMKRMPDHPTLVRAERWVRQLTGKSKEYAKVTDLSSSGEDEEIERMLELYPFSDKDAVERAHLRIQLEEKAARNSELSTKIRDYRKLIESLEEAAAMDKETIQLQRHQKDGLKKQLETQAKTWEKIKTENRSLRAFLKERGLEQEWKGSQDQAGSEGHREIRGVDAPAKRPIRKRSTKADSAGVVPGARARAGGPAQHPSPACGCLDCGSRDWSDYPVVGGGN